MLKTTNQRRSLILPCDFRPIRGHGGAVTAVIAYVGQLRSAEIGDVWPVFGGTFFVDWGKNPNFWHDFSGELV